MDYEAFVYLWFDSKNRKFYLGYHKGHEDDSYTHSSSMMESFSDSNIPSYMRRRILARGSCEDMLQLEVDLLNSRKQKCWDKYYNVISVFPPPPMVGANNPRYIDGRWSDDPKRYKREYYRKYYEKNPEKYQKALESKRKYREENPETVRESNQKSRRKYREKNREKVRESNRKYYQKKKAEKMSTATLEGLFG